ncbi:major histocompatibility complex class I-related gene protein-like [Tiliqua scincoides]|uniref:major histocompatibility complex class I-related gene protein-like n=1 Tax=Tiliqua scincoides TaxID=71010 RepID=UPI00346266B9
MGSGARWVACLLLGASLLRRGCSGTSFNHTLAYLMTGVLEPAQGLPAFSIVGYVDDQCIELYDSDGRRLQPRAAWMEKAGEEDLQYWDRRTRASQDSEMRFLQQMVILRDLYNQSGGLHTLQLVLSCQLSAAGHRTGFVGYGFDGRDFLTLDKETLTWVAAEAKDQAAKEQWDSDFALKQNSKFFVEETCIEWLQQYLRYGKEVLLRRERPVVKVTLKDSQEGLETLLCQAHGFYPKAIDITWRKDEEVRKGDMFHGAVSPNADGTYYTWFSIEIDPKERSHYRCHVEHEGLQEPLDAAVEVSASVPVWFIVGGLLGALVLLMTAIAIYARVGKGYFWSLLSTEPPAIYPNSLDADPSCSPASFQGAKPEPADQGSTL